jgi:hypothetical protein
MCFMKSEDPGIDPRGYSVLFTSLRKNPEFHYIVLV